MASSSDFDVVVLGAGVVGVNSAYWLARAGKKVCVIDRQCAAGLETSFANGGQISVSHAEPWANPSAPLKVLKWLLNGDSPLLFRPKLDVQQWLWLAQFMVDCLPSRTDRHTTQIVKLAIESRALLREIRTREQLDYDQRTRGILHFYRDPKEFESASRVAELMRKYGCDRRVIPASEVVDLEPAFKACRHEVVGATYTADDESGDARKYTQGLAAVCARMGVTFMYGSDVVGLDVERARSAISAVEVRTPEGYRSIRARDVVVCMGSYSAPFLRRYGVSLRIYPAKGYSVTIPIRASDRAPEVSLTDDEHKLVYSNLGGRLRVAGTAELAGYDLRLNHRRCRAIVENVRKTFPQAGDFDAAQFWTGLRPATPSNLPYVGQARGYRNLWLNTGHGTLGWTLGAGSGRLVSDLICDQVAKPALEAPAMALQNASRSAA